MRDTREQIIALVGPILASRGLTLWDVEFGRSGPKGLLRVFIDRGEGGVTLNDCEAVSRELGTVLDVEDVIRHAYTLEVSSPGLDRKLRTPEHFQCSLGKRVRIKTVQALDGQKVFVGTLREVSGGTVCLELEGSAALTTPIENISSATLVPEL